MKKLAFALAAILLLLSSCKKDEVIYRSVFFSGFVDGRTITTDDGFTLHITGETTMDTVKVNRHVFAICDILKTNSDKEYEVFVSSWVQPLTKPSVKKSSLDPSNPLADDPLAVNAAWSCGDYLNLELALPYYGATTHILTMVEDDTADHGDTLCLRMYHNGGTYSGSDLAIASSHVRAYYSLPMESLVPAGDTVVVHLSWTYDGPYDATFNYYR